MIRKIKLDFVILILMLSISSCASTQSKMPALKKIRLATYNTEYCKGNNGTSLFSQENINNIGKVIKKLNPDIIALQELDSASKERGGRFLLKEIAKATGMDYQIFYASAESYNHGNIGCGVLVKSDFKVISVKKTLLPGEEHRACIAVELDKFIFMGTHLDLNDEKRIESARIINQISKGTYKPIFLAGDLNDSHRWNLAFDKVFSEKWEICSTDEYTLSERENHDTIDYILATPNYKTIFNVIESHAVRSMEIDNKIKEISTFSDHLPVYLDLKIK